MRIDIITVFPEMFRGFLGESILSRAVRAGKVFIRTVDLRDFARDQRRTVDDKPYSGGPGMLMRPDVWTEAVEAVRTPGARVVLTTPAGAPYTQRTAEEFTRVDHLVFLCLRRGGPAAARQTEGEQDGARKTRHNLFQRHAAHFSVPPHSGCPCGSRSDPM